MRSSWIIPVDPKYKDKCPYKRQKRGSHKYKGEGFVKTGAETKVMQPLARGGLEPPEAERGKGGFSPRAFRGRRALPPP